MACNLTPEQSKEFFKDKVNLAGLWDAAIDKYMKNGNDFVSTVQSLSAETGHSPLAIKDALLPKDKGASSGIPQHLLDKVWMKQTARRQLTEAAKRLATGIGDSRFAKAYAKYDSTTRQITTFGHFTVFGKTHMGDALFTNPVEYARNFWNSLRVAGEKGRVAHEERMTEMRLDDDYNAAVRSKLDITSRSEASQLLGGNKLRADQLRSHHAFEELQLRRFERFKKAYNSLPLEERNPENGRAIAAVINNATGGGAPGRVGSFLGHFLFGPRLTPAQWRAAFHDNVNMVYKGILDRRNATPGELMAAKMTAKRMGKLLGVYGSLMGIEALLAQTGIIDKKNMPNFTNPKDTGSFLRLKVFGKGIPLSPTIELLTLPLKMIYSGLTAKQNENAMVKFAEPLVKYGLFRLSPGLALGATLASGQETFSGRPLPKEINIRTLVGTDQDKTSKGKPTLTSLTKPRLTYTEFLGERLPIPAAVFLRDVYDEMRAEGLDHATTKTLLQGTMAAATTGVSGYEYHPQSDSPYKRAEEITPARATDKQKAQIQRQQIERFKREKAAQPQPKEFFGFGG